MDKVHAAMANRYLVLDSPECLFSYLLAFDWTLTLAFVAAGYIYRERELLLS